MPVVDELIRREADGTISFGNYELAKKMKREEFECNGDLYKVKTFREITKLERNGGFVYESVPGTAVEELEVSGAGMNFFVEGNTDAQVTLGVDANALYQAYIDGEEIGAIATNVSGKLVVGVDLSDKKRSHVKIVTVPS
jgi:hypothetical protein